MTPYLPRRAALLGLVALISLLAACDDSTSVVPPEPLVLELSPSGTVLLAPGDSVRLVATVQNAQDPAVRFTSSDTTVAVVSAQGMVRALRPGLATMTAASAQDPNASKAVVVRVVGDPAAEDPELAISAVVTEDDLPVRPDSVTGAIRVRVSYWRGAAGRLQVLVGQVVACEEALSGGGGSGQQEFVCPVNTVRADPATGVPTYPNGPAVISARLLSSGGAVLASASTQALTLRNVNTVAVALQAERSAPGADTTTWHGGAVAVRAVPVIFDPAPERAVTRVTFNYAVAGGETVSVTDTEAPFEAIIPRAALAVQDTAFRVQAVTATAAGQGPIATSEPLRVDNVPPEPGSVRMLEWLGATTSPAGLYDPEGQEDAGVGGISVRWMAGGAGQSTERIVASGTPLRVGGDLPASTTAQEYRLVALVCDALENCVPVRGPAFGVDLEAPAIVDLGLPDRAVNPAQGLSLALEDDRSGLPSRALVVRVERVDGDAATESCGPTVGGVDLPGRRVEGACVADTVAGVIPVPRSGAGYYRYEISARDRAGNVSAPVLRTLLVDDAAPLVASVAAPAELTGGDAVSVSARVRDDLDLARLAFAWLFRSPTRGRLLLPVAPDVALSEPFDDRLVADTTVAASLPAIRTLTWAEPGVSPEGRPLALVDSLYATARDAAGLVGRAARAVATAAPNAQPFTNVAAATLTADASDVCTAGCAAGDATSLTAVMRVTGESGLASPFVRVLFFARPVVGEPVLIGADATPLRQDVGAQGTVTFEVTAPPPAGAAGTYTVFAVGVSSFGNALMSPSATVRFFAR